MMSGVTRCFGTAKVLALVIDSGLTYSAALIVELSCYVSLSNSF